jgi:hypothetical protein
MTAPAATTHQKVDHLLLRVPRPQARNAADPAATTSVLRARSGLSQNGTAWPNTGLLADRAAGDQDIE